jgi:hypothetical protein|tara:strand:- start:329 stop:466 length:138 start_codon:yes stop_codon:yes gene_type:complete
MRTGFEDFYTKNQKLCGPVKEEDFDFEKGNLFCAASSYSSHWWTA